MASQVEIDAYILLAATYKWNHWELTKWEHECKLINSDENSSSLKLQEYIMRVAENLQEFQVKWQ